MALENPGAAELAASAGAGGVAAPVYIFFDGTGTGLATSLAMPNRSNIGHPGTPEEIQAFAALLEKTAPRMSAAERKRIVDYLSAQKY
jgi:hypothetical protein